LDPLVGQTFLRVSLGVEPQVNVFVEVLVYSEQSLVFEEGRYLLVFCFEGVADACTEFPVVFIAEQFDQLVDD